MPIRIVCPSCSAALSVKDEFAGRAVKCPKCGGVIPPSQPAAAPPAAPAPPPEPAPAPPPPEPEKSPFEVLGDEPAKPAKSGPKITGKPVSRSRDDEDEDRPRRKDRDDDDRDRDRDRDRGERGKRGDRDRDRERDDKDESKRERNADDKDGDGDKGDRPARKRRRDDDDEDRPSREKKSGGAGTVLLILGALFLVCCGGGGGLAYYLYVKAKRGVEEIVKNIEESNWRVNQINYDQLKVGTTTRTKAEAFDVLGKGRVATEEDLPKVFASEPGRTDAWVAKVNAKRVVVWQDGENYIIAAFHPNAEGTGRLQAKEWRPKNGAALKDGELDDTKFVQKYPAISTTTEIRAEDLSKEYKDSSTAADDKYKDKTFTVTGKFLRLSTFGNEMSVLLEGSPASGPDKFDGREITCKLAAGQTPFAYSRGQRIKVSGKCTGGIGGMANFENCTVKSGETDPSVTVTATKLITDYGNEETADTTYKGKELTITGVRVESIDGGVVTGTTIGKKAPPRKIKIFFDSDLKNKFTNLRAGATVTAKGKCTGLAGDDIHIDDAWFVP